MILRIGISSYLQSGGQLAQILHKLHKEGRNEGMEKEKKKPEILCHEASMMNPKVDQILK